MEIKNSEFRIQNLIKRFKPIIFFVILYFVFLIFFSCSYRKPTTPPPDLIDENKMALVISDITISEAALTNEPLASFNDTLKKLNVLKEYKISSAQFLSSMKYYAETPVKLKDIYAEATEILTKKFALKGDTAVGK